MCLVSLGPSLVFLVPCILWFSTHSYLLTSDFGVFDVTCLFVLTPAMDSNYDSWVHDIEAHTKFIPLCPGENAAVMRRAPTKASKGGSR